MLPERYVEAGERIADLLEYLNELDDGLLDEIDEDYRLRSALADSLELIAEHDTDDADIEEEQVTPTLWSLGFHDEDAFNSGEIFAKTIEDTDEKEVVLEVIPAKQLYRRRTIIWDKTSYGRSSRSIDYESLPMPDEVREAIKNMKK